MVSSIFRKLVIHKNDNAIENNYNISSIDLGIGRGAVALKLYKNQ